jgi:transcription-repair coupling factor (superfamily II helicase)
MISAGIPDSYFLSQTDKLNFYREIEMIGNSEDLEFLEQSFFGSNPENIIPEQTQNLFNLLRCQIYCQDFMILQVKRV